MGNTAPSPPHDDPAVASIVAIDSAEPPRATSAQTAVESCHEPNEEPIFLRPNDVREHRHKLHCIPCPSPPLPPSPTHVPLKHRASRSSTLSLCANCLKMSSPSVLHHSAVFCSKECYWSHHVRHGLDDEPDGSMVLRACPNEVGPDSYIANRNVQRQRKSISTQLTLIRRESNDSPRSRSAGGACPSTSRESSHATSTPEALTLASPRREPSSEPCVTVEEFAEELDESLPTPPQQIPKTPVIKSLKPFPVHMLRA
jgi:hypothetical protein